MTAGNCWRRRTDARGTDRSAGTIDEPTCGISRSHRHQRRGSSSASTASPTARDRQGDRPHHAAIPRLHRGGAVLRARHRGPDGLDCSPRGDAPGFVRVARREDAADSRPARQQPHRHVCATSCATRASRCCSSFPAAARPSASTAAPRSRPIRRWRKASSSTARAPRAVIVVAVERVYLSSAPRRSCARSCGMPSRHVDRKSLPSTGTILAELTDGELGGEAHDRDAHRRG